MYCRVNGRAYKLTLTKDKRWQLHRIAAVAGGKVELFGVYLQRKDVTADEAPVEGGFEDPYEFVIYGNPYQLGVIQRRCSLS